MILAYRSKKVCIRESNSLFVICNQYSYRSCLDIKFCVLVLLCFPLRRMYASNSAFANSLESFIPAPNIN